MKDAIHMGNAVNWLAHRTVADRVQQIDDWRLQEDIALSVPVLRRWKHPVSGVPFLALKEDFTNNRFGFPAID